MRALVLLLLTGCSIEAPEWELIPHVRFGDGLIVHRPALELEGAFALPSRTFARMTFVDEDEAYAEGGVLIVTGSENERHQMDSWEGGVFATEAAGYHPGSQYTFLAEKDGTSYAGHIVAPESPPSHPASYLELYRADPNDLANPTLLYTERSEPRTAAQVRMLGQARNIPDRFFEEPGTYAIVRYIFTSEIENARTEWNLAFGTGAVIYQSVD